MAKPSSVVSWATDLNIASGTEAGTPTKVDPGSGYRAQGLVPGLTFVGPYFNWLINAICSWLDYLNLSGTDELTYASARSYVRRHHLGRGQFAAHAADSRYYSDIGTDGALQLITDESIATVSSCTWREPLPALPVGASFTKLEVFCQPNGLGVVQAKLWKRTPSTTSQLGSNVDTVSTTVGALLTINFTETVAADTCYFLELISYGSTVSGPVTAEARYFELTWSATRATGNY